MAALLRGKRVLILGAGAVGRTVLDLLDLETLRAGQVIVLDRITDGDQFSRHGDRVRFVRAEIERSNYTELLDTYLAAGDICICLTNETDTLALLRHCMTRNIHFVDTANAHWKSENQGHHSTQFFQNQALQSLKRQAHGRPTCLVNQGMNPGVVSALALHALESFPVNELKALYFTEVDSQVPDFELPDDTLACTWSPLSLMEELSLPSEFIRNGHAHIGDSPARLSEIGAWSPSFGAYRGFLVPHREVISLPHKLGWLGAREVDCAFVYRPGSIPKNFSRIRKTQVLTTQIAAGMDEIGVLLTTISGRSSWVGYTLSIESARLLAPRSNATLVMVAAGLLAGLVQILERPHRGILEPEELSSRAVLRDFEARLGIRLRTEIPSLPDTFGLEIKAIAAQRPPHFAYPG